MRKELKSGRVKEGLTVYEITSESMNMLPDSTGTAKSITIDAINDWEWAPKKNLIVATSCLDKKEDDDSLGDPRVTFIQIPNRMNLSSVILKGSLKLKMIFHP